MLLSVNSITKYIKEKKILDEISFKIYNGERIGMVGDNGVGKSTLIKIIIDEISTDGGYVEKYGQIGYLPQDFVMDEEKVVEEFLKEYQSDEELIPILKRLNLKGKYDHRIETLSGGEKTRLYFARLILSKPELLILDEPTNHLDYEGIIWLQELLSAFDGGVLVVSHDRYFLEKAVSKIWEMDKGSIKEYIGSYSSYKEAKEREFERELLEYAKYKKEKRKLEIAARKLMERSNKYNDLSENDFQRGKAAKIAKRSKSIISRVTQMEEMKRPEQPSKINLFFEEEGKKTGNILVRAESLEKSYKILLFKNISFEIHKNKRIAIVGKNGVGKTTLLKGIVGIEELSGKCVISPSTKIGYFSQELKNLDEDLTVLEEVKKVERDQAHARNLLASMLFKEADVFKQIKNLSLGEKVRIIFLKLVLFHHDSERTDIEIDAIEKQAQSTFKDCIAAREGLKVSLL